jgi:hypothetical protein
MANYKIVWGKPHAFELWDDLLGKARSGKLGREEKRLFKKLTKFLRLISENPRFPGLNSHAIDTLSKEAGVKVWESYLENNTPGARRVFWAYGPQEGTITILAVEPHPEKGGYTRVKLSRGT